MWRKDKIYSQPARFLVHKYRNYINLLADITLLILLFVLYMYCVHPYIYSQLPFFSFSALFFAISAIYSAFLLQKITAYYNSRRFSVPNKSIITSREKCIVYDNKKLISQSVLSVVFVFCKWLHFIERHILLVHTLMIKINNF